MAKFCLKKPSKRVPAKRRYKVEKKIREHNRKKRKEAKKKANKPLKKLIPVPNICPFKQEILQEAEIYKIHQKEEKQKAWERAMIEKVKKAQNIEELASVAQQKDIDFESEKVTSLDCKTNESNIKTFYREFQKVILNADIILEVVDARDPLGTRCPAVEEAVKSSGGEKKLVLVLNKADLIPRDILQKWTKYLRKQVPCIPFKSSTQTQSKKLGRKKMKMNKEVTPGGICVGAEGLMSLLANYTRNNGIKTSIRVGVVGIPNVGKSSLINSLKRSKACQVGAMPGVTRSVQEIQLDSKIKLLDSPGLAFVNPTDPHAALKNYIKVKDPIEPSNIILQRANKTNMMRLYLVNDYKDANDFLSQLAKRYGKYKKGGILDLEAAAKVLVDDWNKGKIEYYTVPPEDGNEHDISSAIVTSDVPEFDLDAYDAKVFMAEPTKMDTGDASEKSDDFEIVVRGGRKPKNMKENKDEVSQSLMQLEGNQRLNKFMKVRSKRARKMRAKQERKANELADVLDDIKLTC